MTDYLVKEVRKEFLTVIMHSASAGSVVALVVMAIFGQVVPPWLRITLALAGLPIFLFIGLVVLDGWMTLIKYFRTIRDLREKKRLETVRKVMES